MSEGLRLLGYGFADALSARLPARGRALHRRHARRLMGAIAWPGGKCLTTLVRGRCAAFSRRVVRPHPGRAWAGRGRGPAPAAAPAVAGAGAGRAAAAGGAQPRQPVGAGRALALRPGPAFFPRRTGHAVARGAVRAGALGARALCPAAREPRPDRHGAAGSGRRRAFPGLGGVHMVEATKSLYAPATPAPARRDGAPCRGQARGAAGPR